MRWACARAPRSTESLSLAGVGGAISPSGITDCLEGSSLTLSIVPDKGYEIASVKVNGKEIGPVETYTFSHIVAPGQIEATFAEKAAPSSPGHTRRTGIA